MPLNTSCNCVCLDILLLPIAVTLGLTGEGHFCIRKNRCLPRAPKPPILAFFYRNSLILKANLILMVKIKVTSFLIPPRPVHDQNTVNFEVKFKNGFCDKFDLKCHGQGH